tara:strand:- start:2211 stop:2681 length:471 start_codon:yes stop_codon:yes gene_type:complete
MGRVFIFDVDDTLIIHTKDRNDYYNLNTQNDLKNVIEKMNYKGIYIYTNGTYSHGKNVIDNLNLDVNGIFGRDTIPYMKPHYNSFSFVKNIIDMNTDVQNDEYIFFDDLLDNLKTAKSVGWKTIWITPEFSNYPDFVDYSFPNVYQALIHFSLEER